MVQSAKVQIKQQDRSAIIPKLTGIEVGTVIRSLWGSDRPVLVSSANDYLKKFSKSKLTSGTSFLGGEVLASNTDKLWVQRIINSGMRYSGALVRSTIDPMIPSQADPDWRPDYVVKPLRNGIGQNVDLDNYQFQKYTSTPLFTSTGATIESVDPNKMYCDVSSIDFGADSTLKPGDKISINNVDMYQISTVDTIDENSKSITITSQDVSGEIYEIGSTFEIEKTPGAGDWYVVAHLLQPSTLTDGFVLYVDNNDLLQEQQNILVRNIVAPHNYNQIQITKKNSVDFTFYRITFTTLLGAEFVDGAVLSYVVNDGTYYKDAFVVRAIYLGYEGNYIDIGVKDVDIINNTFTLEVYYHKNLVESFECSLNYQNDGFGRQTFIEEVVNGVSNYIVVKANPAITTTPLSSEYSIVRRVAERYYIPSSSSTSEEIFVGDSQVYTYSLDTALIVGTAFVFRDAKGNTISSEYTITSTDSVNKSFTVNRPFKENIPIGSTIAYFDSGYEDPTNMIWRGCQYFQPEKLLTVYFDNNIDDIILIGGKSYQLLDSGYNLTFGGLDGNEPTEADIITAFNKLSAIDTINVYVDNGFATPNVANAINQITSTKYAHGFLSTPEYCESSNDVNKIVDYANNQLNMNSAYSSLFAGWVATYDNANAIIRWVAPSVYACVAQSFVTRNYQIFTPAAGWNYGVVNASNIKYKFNEAERDLLVSNKINPIRYENGVGIAVWGNETLYSKPSPLQLRSVAFLLIVLKYGLANYLEFELFELNNEDTWDRTETVINQFINDNLYLPGGLYDYQVAVKDIITPSDIDNRTMPIFVGIQPTMDINFIPVTIAIFNRSLEISI